MAQEETKEVVAAQIQASKAGNRLWRNNRGVFYTKHGTLVKAGLSADGSGDLIGYTVVKITPDMVGKNIAVFTSAEGKRRGWKGVKSKTEKQQQNFADHVNSAGGIAFFFDNGEKILEKIQEGIDRLRNKV